MVGGEYGDITVHLRSGSANNSLWIKSLPPYAESLPN